MTRILWTVLFSSLALAAAADKIFMKDSGVVYEGKILEETDTAVKIRTSKTVMVLQKDRIEKIERGVSPMELFEERLAALAPDNPAGYLEAAQWCIDQKLGDEATIRRLANIAMGLDPALCARGNLLLGDYLVWKGDRVEAVEYFVRSYLADWENAETRRRIEGLKDVLGERNRKALTKLKDALTLAIDGRLAEAILALQAARSSPCSDLISTYAPEYASLDALIADLRARIPCKKCGGAGVVACSECGGDGKVTCSVCDGTGEKVVDVGGREKRHEPCTACNKKGTVPCQRCKDPKGRVKCPLCRGVVPPKPAGNVNKSGLIAFRNALDARLKGDLPVEDQVGPKMPVLGARIYDPEYLDDGLVIYRDGKWIAPGEKK